MNLSSNIAKLRKEAGLTQEKLAELCGVSRQAVTKWESGESEPTIEKIEILTDIFKVSADELIKGIASVKSERNNRNDEVDKNFLFTQCIGIINRFYDMQSFFEQGIRYMVMKELYETIKNHYIDQDGKILEKYLVANTTKSDRGTICAFLSGPIRCPFQPFEDYIDGKIEITDAIDEVAKEFERKSNTEHDLSQAKRKTKIGLLFIRLNVNIGDAIDCDDYSDKKLEEIKADVLEAAKDIKADSVATNSLLFFASEFVNAVSNRDNDHLKQLAEEWYDMHEAIWRLI